MAGCSSVNKYYFFFFVGSSGLKSYKKSDLKKNRHTQKKHRGVPPLHRIPAVLYIYGRTPGVTKFF